MIEIKLLSGVNIKTIHNSFERAFSDYVEPFKISVSLLKYMIERRGYNEDISFGAFDEGELVGFTLNGKGMWNNLSTAYDTGTGIVKEYRKQGIATKMFTESLQILRDNGIEQYLLEVIKSNTKAYDLYKKAGFSVVREFDYFVSEVSEFNLTKDKLPDSYSFLNDIRPDWDLLRSFWEFVPSWQNSVESIQRKESGFKIIGISFENNIIGYGIIEPETGDIPQFCIDKDHRNRKLGTILFSELAKYSKNGEIRIINTAEEYEPVKKFMKSLNISPGLGQYEMILPL